MRLKVIPYNFIKMLQVSKTMLLAIQTNQLFEDSIPESYVSFLKNCILVPELGQASYAKQASKEIQERNRRFILSRFGKVSTDFMDDHLKIMNFILEEISQERLNQAKLNQEKEEVKEDTDENIQKLDKALEEAEKKGILKSNALFTSKRKKETDEVTQKRKSEIKLVFGSKSRSQKTQETPKPTKENILDRVDTFKQA